MRINRSRSRKYARPRPRSRVLQGSGRDWLLEDRCLLANGPVDLPSNSVNTPNDVLFNSVFNPYQKTLTITNNSPTQWIYPFIEGELTYLAQGKYAGTAGYDPYDPSTQEYRAYVGYFGHDNLNNPHNYAGLPPLSSITIFVPIAFWDSGRFIVSTDGADQFNTYGGPNSGNPPGAPFNFLYTDTQGKFYGSINAGTTNQLTFTTIYNSFDGSGMPSAANWKSPIASGLFKNSQQFVVTGPGLPAGGETVTINSNNPNFVTLPTPGTATAAAQEYVFAAVQGQSIAPTAHNVQAGFGFTNQGTTTNTGLVMWYHSLNPVGPNNDAPFQLNELSFRGTYYDDTIKTNNKNTGFQFLLPAEQYNGAKTDSADYDLSFVDSINLPVAIEATNATVPNTTTQLPFGWVGSDQSVEAFQAAVQAFSGTNSATNNNFLGTYFGGKGYPVYVAINPANPKLPAGQNLFLASPAVPGGVADIQYYKAFPAAPPVPASEIRSPLYALTTGGSGPSQLVIGGDASHPSQGQDLGLNTTTGANQYALNTLMKANFDQKLVYNVTYNVGGTTFSAGNATGFYYAADNTTIIGVKLDQAVPANASSLVYAFKLPQHDYAAGGIAGLWYSWAQYYANNVVSTPMNGVAGTLAAGSNILTLTSPASGLVPGMAVTTAFGAPTPPGCVILSISTDQKTIKLSTAATGGASSFNFATPSFASIPGYDKNGSPDGNTPHVDLTFTAAQQPYALAFAQTVFTVMRAWAVNVPPATPNGWAPLMNDIIGGLLGPNILPNANPDVVLALTDMSKSVLRGVPDFTSPLYSNPAQWYPDPALAAGGQTYNVFNLNPYVWFIHDKLGLTAYAFALDDEIGNVNAGGATNVNFSIGGLNGLPNKDPYTSTSPWGVVPSGVASATQAKSSVIAGLTNPNVVYQTAQYNYANTTPGTLVNGPGVPTGTTVQFITAAQSQVTLSNPLTTSSTGPFSFFGSNTFTGTVLGRGQANNTIYLTSQDAYNTLLKLGPLQNIQVTGEGIDPTKIVTIQNLFKSGNNLVVQLSDSLHPALVSQKGSFYGYTFGSPLVTVIHDPGFEWADVSKLTGQFNHGLQLTQNTVDWTFTDSTTNPAWFAGIAYGNTSTYTTGSPPPPQALQVGFVQGNSSISQKVTLGNGTYTLSLLAAQRATSQPPQALSVLVDGVSVGTIQPSGTAYQPLSVKFTITGGKHTITLQGTQAADSTVLIDSVACVPEATALFASSLPPLLNSIPDQQVIEGSTDTFAAHASSSSSALTYSLAPGAPAGAQIDPLTGVFTWTPTAAGSFPVTIDVADNSSPPIIDEQTFTITVDRVTSYAAAVSSLAKPTYGQSLFFGAAIGAFPGAGAPTGTIQFVVDGVNFGQPVAMVNGAAISPSLATLGAGVHHEAAVYSGDANYAPIVSPILTTTIAPAPLLIVASSATKVYGQANPPIFAAGFGFAPGQSLADLAGTLSVVTTATAASHVGLYPVVASGLTSANYAITYVNGTMIVTPAPLVITADDATRALGQPNPLLSAIYAGFVDGDTAASLTTPVALSAAATPLSPVGAYAIAARGASSPDYAITLVPGTLSVTPPPVGASPITQEWTAFVTVLYQEILGRNPDPDGLAFWVRTLNRHVPRSTVALAFWNSPERNLLLSTGHAPKVALATALADAQAAGQVAFSLASNPPAGPLSLIGSARRS